MRFLKAWESIGPMWLCEAETKAEPGSHFLPSVAPSQTPRTRREDRILVIVRDEFTGVFLNRVGRHQSPSPLHRHGQTNTGFLDETRNRTFLLCREADISTLP